MFHRCGQWRTRGVEVAQRLQHGAETHQGEGDESSSMERRVARGWGVRALEKPSPVSPAVRVKAGYGGGRRNG